MVFLILAILVQPPDLPEAPGKAVVQKICTSCHTLGVVVSQRRTHAAWQKNVDDMTARGMEATDEEMGAAVEYFTRFFGKVNVNRAPAEEIAAVLDIPGRDAAALVKYRQENGEFKSLEGLSKAPGLDSKKVEERKERILLR